MGIDYETLQQFRASGGLKATTITARQLLPAVVAHMQRMDRSFSLQINGRLPKPMDELLDEVFALCHLQQQGQHIVVEVTGSTQITYQ